TEQFRRVRGSRSAGEHRERLADAVGERVERLLVDKEGRRQAGTIRQREVAVRIGLAEVSVDQQYPASGFGERLREVRGRRALALALARAGDQDDLRLGRRQGEHETCLDLPV